MRELTERDVEMDRDTETQADDMQRDCCEHIHVHGSMCPLPGQPCGSFLCCIN